MVAKGAVDYFPARAVRGLAVTQIMFGCVVIIAQIVVLAVYNLFFNHVSQGIWCGVAFIVCGTFGIVSARRRTVPWMVAHLTLCIIICLFCAAIIALSALTSVYYFGSLYTYQYQPCPGNDGFPMYYGTGPSGPGYYDTPGGTSENDYWGRYYSTGGFQGPSQYYPGQGGQLCFGRYVINIPWIVQFTMNILMGLIGIINAIVSVVAATLSCSTFCYNKARKEEKKELINSSSDPYRVDIIPPAYCEKPPIENQGSGFEAFPGASHV